MAFAVRGYNRPMANLSTGARATARDQSGIDKNKLIELIDDSFIDRAKSLELEQRLTSVKPPRRFDKQ